MHVHANYSQQLASVGASRTETQEIAERRSAEVRRRLSAASTALHGSGDETSTAAAAVAERQPGDQRRQQDESEQFGQFFSARA